MSIHTRGLAFGARRRRDPALDWTAHETSDQPYDHDDHENRRAVAETLVGGRERFDGVREHAAQRDGDDGRAFDAKLSGGYADAFEALREADESYERAYGPKAAPIDKDSQDPFRAGKVGHLTSRHRQVNFGDRRYKADQPFRDATIGRLAAPMGEWPRMTPRKRPATRVAQAETGVMNDAEPARPAIGPRRTADQSSQERPKGLLDDLFRGLMPAHTEPFRDDTPFQTLDELGEYAQERATQRGVAAGAGLGAATAGAAATLAAPEAALAAGERAAIERFLRFVGREGVPRPAGSGARAPDRSAKPGRSSRPEDGRPEPHRDPYPPFPPEPPEDKRRRRTTFIVRQEDFPQIYAIEEGLDELEPWAAYPLTYAGDGPTMANIRRALQRKRLGVRRGTRDYPFHEWPPASTAEGGAFGGGGYVPISENNGHGQKLKGHYAGKETGRRLVPGEIFDYLLIPRRNPHE